MINYIARKIAKILPDKVIYWCVVFACREFHKKVEHLKNRDELNLNDLVGYWFDKTK